MLYLCGFIRNLLKLSKFHNCRVLFTFIFCSAAAYKWLQYLLHFVLQFLGNVTQSSERRKMWNPFFHCLCYENWCLCHHNIFCNDGPSWLLSERCGGIIFDVYYKPTFFNLSTTLCFGQELEKCKRKQTFTCLNSTELLVPNAIMILKTCIFGFTFFDTSFGSYNWASTDDMHDDKLILLEFLAVAIRSIMPCLNLGYNI